MQTRLLLVRAHVQHLLSGMPADGDAEIPDARFNVIDVILRKTLQEASVLYARLIMLLEIR